MAKSGTINGTQSGNRPYLRLKWDIRSQDVANNRSRVRLRLYIVAPYRVSYSANKKGSLHGSGFTHTSGMSGTGEKLIRTQEVWVSHSSNGSKSVSFSAWYDINITFSGSYMGRISVSGTASLDTIPRASTLSSFSMGASLKEGTANTVRLGISKASSSFRHDIQLRIGSTIIASWNGQNTPSSLSLSASQVNNLLSRMSTVTSATVTLRVQTKNGSSNVGGIVSRTATASVSSTVLPTINSRFDIVIAGNGKDKNISEYVQNMSKVKVDFTSSAQGGASVSKRTVYVDGRAHNGYSITSQTLTKSGTVPVKVEITDSRGRKASQTKNITVRPYSTPNISLFTAERESGNQTRVQIRANGTSSSVNGKNSVNVKIQKMTTNVSSWSTLNDHNTSNSFSRSITDTGADETTSYSYRIIATDTLGATAIREQSVSTARVLMDLNGDKGIGIGKAHERGALDVDGEVYFGGVRFDHCGELPSGDGGRDYWLNTPQGKYTFMKDTFNGQPVNYGFADVMKVDGYAEDVTIAIYKRGSGKEEAYLTNLNTNLPQSHMPEWVPLVAPDYVTEVTGIGSGNGYEKWSSGKLIVWARGTIDISGNSTATLNIESPLPLVSGGNVQATIRTSSNSTSGLRITRAMVTGSAGKNGGATINLQNTSSSSRENVQVQVEMRVRWK